MKIKTIKQQLNLLIAQNDKGENVDLALLAELKSVLQDKKAVCKYKLRHRLEFSKRERTEKKLKKVKSCLKRLKVFEELLD